MEKTGPIFNERNFDINSLLSEFKKRRFLFIGFAVIALSLAFALTKYLPRKYNLTSIPLLKTDDNQNYDPNALFKNFGGFSAEKNYRNEILVLQSTPLLLKVISRMDLNVSYYRYDDIFFKQMLYKSNPFVVLMDRDSPQPLKLKINIQLVDSDHFKIKASGKDIAYFNFGNHSEAGVVNKVKVNQLYSFGEKIENQYLRFTVLKQNIDEIEKNVGKKYQVVINRNLKLVSEFKQNLKVQMADNESSAINIAVKDASALRGIEFLSNLIDEYLNFNTEKKDQIAENTITYIDQQLSQIQDSLSFTEQRLQDYRRSKNVINTDTRANKIYDQLVDLENQKAQLVIRAKYYQYIGDYFEQNKNFSEIIAPSSTGIEDNLLTNMIQELTSLNSEINSLEKNNQQKSPYYKTLQDKISNLKNTIYENIKYLNNTSSIALDNITTRIEKINYEINQLPKTEREMVSIERKFKLNDAIYTFLLQKRAESQITKASNLPSTEIIEPPTYAGVYFPNVKLNFLVAIFLALAFPVIFVVMQHIINDRVRNLGELENLSPFPVIGNIFNAGQQTEMILNPGKSIDHIEKFKSIRTNLDYFLPESTSQIILVTSATGSDGKSFATWNLGSVLAQIGKKTLILNYDLRKPFVNEQTKPEIGTGISSFLINRANFEDILQETQQDNLFYIPPGDIPPNPSELITSKKSRELMDLATQSFDVVLIDTPPMGLFTDAELLIKMAQFVIFIVRENHTEFKVLRNIFRDLESKKIENIGVVFNHATRISKERYYYYKKHKKGKGLKILAFLNKRPPKK